MRRPAGAGKRKAGLNENYAREVMELHTLGVDGGYTQKDVTEVARCLTGWTIRGLRQNDPRFVFLDAVHDQGDKVVLGHRIKPGGIKEGEEMIHVLATHPAHRPLHLLQAGPPVRGRRAAGRPGGSRGGDVPQDGRRTSARSCARS